MHLRCLRGSTAVAARLRSSASGNIDETEGPTSVSRRPFDVIDYKNPKTGLRRLQSQAQLLAHRIHEHYGIRIWLNLHPGNQADVRLKRPFQPIINPVGNAGSIDHRPSSPTHPTQRLGQESHGRVSRSLHDASILAHHRCRRFATKHQTPKPLPVQPEG